MKVNRLRNSRVEIFMVEKIIWNNFFTLKETKIATKERHKLNLDIPKYNEETFGRKNLRVFGSKA